MLKEVDKNRINLLMMITVSGNLGCGVCIQGFDIHCVLGKLLHLPYCHVDKVVHNADGK